MERCPTGKPYAEALRTFPQHKAEIMALPEKYCRVISAFPYHVGRYGMDEEDYFSTLVLLCLEADQRKATAEAFHARACREIDTELAERKQETQQLYNPFRNLYLDKCYGDSKDPLGAWINFGSEE